MININTNYGSMYASKAASASQRQMDVAMERLSTGLRINSAKDDAAGQAVATRLSAESKSLSIASSNAADAQSMVATAEGALQESHTVLLRMRELAVQSSNDTVRDQDRDMLQTEVAQLEAEIQRISDDTTWSGLTLLAGGFSTGATFQIGPGRFHQMAISLSAIDATTTIANGGLNLSSHVSTQALAQAYLANISNAISVISADRAKYGAFMNRLDHAMANMANVATNLSAAKGRIEDADYAAESANLARTQVLQQASMAMLSQANASKQNILSLFQ